MTRNSKFDPATLQAHMDRGLRMRSEAFHAMLSGIGTLFGSKR